MKELSHAMSDRDAHATAQELVLRFLTHLTREMRTSLHSVVGFAELMQASATLDDARDYAGLVLRATEELRRRMLGTAVAFQAELHAIGLNGAEHGPNATAPFEPLFAALRRVEQTGC